MYIKQRRNELINETEHYKNKLESLDEEKEIERIERFVDMVDDMVDGKTTYMIWQMITYISIYRNQEKLLTAQTELTDQTKSLMIKLRFRWWQMIDDG